MNQRIYEIPQIADDELLRLYSAIKPIISLDGEKFYCREFTPKELRGISYTWDKAASKGEPADFALLKEVGKISTLHAYGYYGIFKPSVAEVLSQIPTHLLASVVAFEITDWPREAMDLHKNVDALNAGFHVAETTLYSAK